MKTGPALLTKYVIVYEIKLDDGKKSYYDVALPFWNLVDVSMYTKNLSKTWLKVMHVFPL